MNVLRERQNHDFGEYLCFDSIMLDLVQKRSSGRLSKGKGLAETQLLDISYHLAERSRSESSLLSHDILQRQPAHDLIYLSSIAQLSKMHNPVYPIHGFARPVRVYPMPGNAFAQQIEMQRQREAEAQQQQPSPTSVDRSSYVGCYADSLRNLGRPVSSWSFVINHNNDNIRNAPEHNQQQTPDINLDFDSARAQSELRHVLLPENDSALDGLSDLYPDVESPDFTISERDQPTAFRQDNQSSDFMTPGSGERSQQARPNIDSHNFGSMASRRGERYQPTPLRPDNQASESTPHRTGNSQPTLSHTGDPSSQFNMPRMVEHGQSTPLRFNDQASRLTPRRNEHNYSSHTRSSSLAHRSNMPTIAERIQPTPLSFNNQSSEFTPHGIEHNQPNLARPGDLFSDSNVSRRLERNQPTLVRPGDLNSESTVPGHTQNNQPTLDHSAMQSSQSEPVLPRRNQRNQSNVARPDSQASEVLMPRRTPPARYAALTNQLTAPMPAFLTTSIRDRHVTPQSEYVQRAAGNDAIMMGSGPMIPTRDGNCGFFICSPKSIIILTI